MSCFFILYYKVLWAVITGMGSDDGETEVVNHLAYGS